ncbi:hypothetical protein ASA1KI_00110 [Opitutales bacterium ASA1]|nr:hypothetical protein ASA1KI_00110 [Opitutales bacterium ASA1]
MRMEFVETGGLVGHGVVGAIPVLTAIPLSILFTVAALIGINRARVDAYVAEKLDALLSDEASRMRKKPSRGALDFRTAETIPATRVGLGLGRVKVHRTILSSMRDGYRVRIRAFASGARGRVIVRTVDVDVKGRR